MSCYIVQEIDGVGRFTLEDSSGFLALENCIPTPDTGDAVMGGLLSQAEAQAKQGQQATLKRRRLEQDDEDWMSILLNGL